VGIFSIINLDPQYNQLLRVDDPQRIQGSLPGAGNEGQVLTPLVDLEGDVIGSHDKPFCLDKPQAAPLVELFRFRPILLFAPLLLSDTVTV
jgi:hypothetical protein